LAVTACRGDADGPGTGAPPPLPPEATPGTGTGLNAAQETPTASPPTAPPHGDGSGAALEPDRPDGDPHAQSQPQQPESAFEVASMRQEELRGMAMAALDADDRNLAIAALIALSETPEMSELKVSGVLLLSELYHEEGESERALTLLAALSEMAPPIGEIAFVYGRMLAELGRNTEAEAQFRRAIEIRPDMLQSYLYLGSILVGTERSEAAAQVYADYEQVLARLLALVGDAERNEDLRIEILDTLRYAAPDRRVTEALIPLLSDRSLFVRATAVDVLGSVGTAEALAPLDQLGERTEHAELRAMVEEARARIAARGL
jgi:hypothetical protein